MKLARTYTRMVRTSRRLVFENIMDLDHVCVVHAKWFRHLRIRTWKPERVEYRLRATFHGLHLECDVRGGRIDDDSYWYEFETSLALMRVDGRLEGADGNLLLTERITQRFAAPLWPLFAALGAFFRRQKEDILRDDTRLLERAYELENAGFQRCVARGRPEVVVFGGTGFFGRLVVRDLLERTNATIRVASRNPLEIDFQPHETRVHSWIVDLRDEDVVRRLVRGATACVVCAGPFQGMPLTIARACVAERVPYVDAADDRDFVERCSAFDSEFRAAGVPAFVGCSVVPGMSAILANMACARTVGADLVRICITPGTRRVRGPASFACLLDTVGRTFLAPRDGGLERVAGWTQPREVEFPPDIGARSAYRVVDVADHVTMPRRFGASTVEFRIGSEFRFLNRLLAMHRVASAWVPRRAQRLLIPFYRAFIDTVGRFGTTRGAMQVEVTGRDGGRATVCVHRATDGHGIPSALPAIAVQTILAGSAPAGVVPLADWISAEDFAAAMRERGIEVSERVGDGAWSKWTPRPRTQLATSPA